MNKGRNGGSWNGVGGLVTSETAAIKPNFLTTLAVDGAGDAGLTSFKGISVASCDVIAMYTYAGDMNLDGTIDADDYFRIDQGYSKRSTGYAHGDLNYSGAIDGDDYFIIDSNFASHPPAMAAAVPSAVQAVPEPGTMLGGFVAIAILRRRRRG